MYMKILHTAFTTYNVVGIILEELAKTYCFTTLLHTNIVLGFFFAASLAHCFPFNSSARSLYIFTRSFTSEISSMGLEAWSITGNVIGDVPEKKFNTYIVYRYIIHVHTMYLELI